MVHDADEPAEQLVLLDEGDAAELAFELPLRAQEFRALRTVGDDERAQRHRRPRSSARLASANSASSGAFPTSPAAEPRRMG